MRIGFTEEAARVHALAGARAAARPTRDGSLQIMYGDRRPPRPRPRRRSTTSRATAARAGAHRQRRLRAAAARHLRRADGLGLPLQQVRRRPISYDLWVELRAARSTGSCDNWQQHDEGIWEVRGGRQHFVYSKLMCWVALDRALRLADKRSFPADRQRWLETRDAIYEEIMASGWSDERAGLRPVLRQRQRSTPSNLIMPLVFFVSPTDPRMLRPRRHPRTPTRRRPDHRRAWSTATTSRSARTGCRRRGHVQHVHVLAGRGADPGRPARRGAALIFEQMLGYANHLGLYAEEIGPRARRSATSRRPSPTSR